MSDQKETINFDVLFVGAGPANLASSIRLMQIAKEKNLDIEIAIIDKGMDIGSHSLSGAILNPIALKELLPEYAEMNFPVEKRVIKDSLYALTKNKSFKIPFTPINLKSSGYLIISLSKFTKWLSNIAEEMGANIFPGFSGVEAIYDKSGSTIIGVRTGEKGISKEFTKKSNYEPPMDIYAKVTIFGEGAKGSLFRDVAKKLDLFKDNMPQVYETGIKEIIEIRNKQIFQDINSNAIHSLFYPLDFSTFGGGFIYEMNNNLISIGLVVGLSYENPYLDIYEKFIQFKKHPFILNIIKEGKVLETGARTVCTGGYYSMPKLYMDGGLVVGNCASFHNNFALKGIHTSMKSGMIAAETIISGFEKNDFSSNVLKQYKKNIEKSWIQKEMLNGRNFAQAMAKKALAKFLHLGALHFTNGKGLIDPLRLKRDSKTLKNINKFDEPDNINKLSSNDKNLFLDKLTSLYLSNTSHEEDQPCHIKIINPDICIKKCIDYFNAPCTRFCPGSVYELTFDNKSNKKSIKLNPSNCLHCKTCEIKDPFENILWNCPEGGDGPKYSIV